MKDILVNFSVKYSTSGCFVCGENNLDGFRVHFTLEGTDSVFYRVKIPEKYQGYDGIVHGGVIATMLDEAMANCFFLRGIECVTVEMSTKFRKALPVDHEVVVFGKITEQNPKAGVAEAWIVDDDGIKYAEGEGKYLLLKEIDKNSIKQGKI